MTRYERAMHDLQLQRAIQWIGECLDQEPQGNRAELIDQASQEFGLNPKQEEFLYHFFFIQGGGRRAPAILSWPQRPG